MKTKMLFILLAFSASTSMGQDSKKNAEKEYEKMKVPTCTVSGVNFAKGDTITIGQPANTNQKFSFLHRRFGVFEGIRELEKFRLSIEWSNRLVLINETYLITEGLNKVCYAEFKVGNDFRGWITLDNAIKTKEIVKLNSKDLN
ncbi:hypothetical protein [Emticicia agri]|uniref:Uncharacterized protein n=1 Tax=Emticicia agri TaxID=2492393 RepID=A0A4Q5LVS9_9BACT|nr:hypothetical protein [Emticicia agri]RYU93774.1 hypothetical protein EWM59_20420 [Emticicia agri]